MKAVKGMAMGILALLGAAMLGTSTGYAQEESISDNRFTFFNGAATVADTTAPDGYSAHMSNNGTGWNIQYQNWDFGTLKAGALYDVYAKVKVKHAVSLPSGNAFTMGVYDLTDANSVLPSKTVAAAETQDGIWKEVKIGTFMPNAGVNALSIYVGGTGNVGQISDIYVDAFMFKEHKSYTIEDNLFYTFNDASLVSDGMAVDNSAAKLLNGSGTGWNIQAKIDGSRVEAGKTYKITAGFKPERSDWKTSSGDMFGYLVYDLTTNSMLVQTTIVNSASLSKVLYFDQLLIGSVTIDPTHDVRVCFFPVNNAANFPAVKIDSVTLSQQPLDESASKIIHAYPYKLSPSNQDGLNDSTQIKYSLASPQTVSVSVQRYLDQTTVRTLTAPSAQSGNQSVFWDGKNDSGQYVGNGLYTIRVSNGTIDLLRTNVQVFPGVTLTPSPNTVKNDVPKGIFYEAGAIPYNIGDAGVYLNNTFGDIHNLGADTVFLANWHAKPAGIYSETLAQAAQNQLKVVGLPDAYSLFNETLFNDEQAMYEHINGLVAPYRNNSALYAYYLADEPGNDLKLADNLKDIQRMLETIDPSRAVISTFIGLDRLPLHYNTQKPKVMNIDPYGVREGNAIGDFRNMYHYPGFTFETYMDFASYQTRKDVKDDAPMWTILQTNESTGWLRNPTAAEIRAMTYGAIGHGSKGFTYFVYQTELDWIGIVDENYNPAPDYPIVQTLFSEIETLKPTLKRMKRIANVATATGGGNVAYASAEVTTHIDTVTGDKYLVIVNHDCENAANISITIDRAALGMDISAVTNMLDQSGIAYTASPTGYTISNLNFAAGDGKVLKLTKDVSQIVYVGEDSAFHVNNGAVKSLKDVSASDSMTAKHTVTASRTWNIQWFWERAQLTPGTTYDLYADVKIKYATDVYKDSNGIDRIFQPSGNAFSYGVYDLTANNYPVLEKLMPAADMENMFWHTIKIGTFVPSQTNNQVVYIMPWDNQGNVQEVYVDKFYFVKR
ncbi:FlgD immunoglobulin-like domain containing protein [Cohnella sp. WQ 127256]|uniref:FlgD immunoglobulin-like domain containing protein n=1 Tax=Cohnella sp. WQ 127256 TaxID=2938790 RepID=UPI002118E1D9|nr:FlgD immunoglobulin-like domain containing protein [Cohnella sp. WQ 127256]